MLEKGLQFIKEVVVKPENLAVAMGSGDLPVLATPAMVAFMENAALSAVEDQLPAHNALERKSFWSHPRVSTLAQGLINPELQQFDDWKILFADDLAARIIKHRYWKKEIKNNVEITLSEADAKSFLSRQIQELLK